MAHPVRLVRRDECPTCKSPVERLADGRLAFHYMQGPGIGMQCPGEAGWPE